MHYTCTQALPLSQQRSLRAEGILRAEGKIKGRLGRWTNVVILGAEHVEWRATEAFQQEMPGDLCAVAEFIGGRSATLACWQRLVSP